MTQELSKSMRRSNDHACFAMFDPLAHVLTDMFFPSSFPWKNVFYSTLQYMLHLSFSLAVIFFRLNKCYVLLQATNNKQWKYASEKKLRNLHKNAHALGPNENLLQVVTIEAKTVLLNGSLSHNF